MKKFLIKASTGGKNNPFFLTEPSEFVYLYCHGLTDLRKTMRCVTARGYRVRSAQWFSKMLRDGPLTLLSPFFKTTMFEIKQISFCPKIEAQGEFTNTAGITYNLKVVAPDKWDIE